MLTPCCGMLHRAARVSSEGFGFWLSIVRSGAKFPSRTPKPACGVAFVEGWLLQLPQVWQPCQKVSFQWVLAGGDNPDELGPSVFPATPPVSLAGINQAAHSCCALSLGICVQRDAVGTGSTHLPSAENWSLLCQCRGTPARAVVAICGDLPARGGFVLLSFPVYETFTLCTKWRGGQAG